MKYIILIFIFTIKVFTQDFEPSQARSFNPDIWQQYLTHTSNLTTILPDNYIMSPANQTKYLKGFEIGQHANINTLLGMNSVFSFNLLRDFDDASVNPNGTTYYPLLYFTNFVQQKNVGFDNQYPRTPYEEGKTWIGTASLPFQNCAAIEWKPTLKIPYDKRGEYIKQVSEGNTNKYVFGFSIINSNCSTSINNELLTMDTDDFDGAADILSNAWVKPMFLTKNLEQYARYHFDSTDRDKEKWFYTYKLGDRGYLGMIWYLSINLKLLDAHELQDDDVVLEIRLPGQYRIPGETSSNTFSINFNGLPGVPLNPDENNFIYSNLDDFSGDASRRTTVFQITKGMLPTNNDLITLSAQFFTNGTVSNNINYQYFTKIGIKNYGNDNPAFPSGYYLTKDYYSGFTHPTKNLISSKGKSYNPDEYFVNYNDPIELPIITNLDIKVKYMDNADLAINWIRIENPLAQAILRDKIYYDKADDQPGYESDYVYNTWNYNLIPKHWTNITSVPYLEEPDDNEHYHKLYSPKCWLETQINYLDSLQKAVPFRNVNTAWEFDHPFLWRTLRFFNKISNNYFINRDSYGLSDFFYFYTGAQARYVDMRFQSEPFAAVPFIRYGFLPNYDYELKRYANIQNGYNFGLHVGRWGQKRNYTITLEPGSLEFNDSLYSHYETFVERTSIDDESPEYIKNLFHNFKSMNYSEYYDIIHATKSFQSSYERGILDFFNDDIKNDSLLFEPKNKWYVNIFAGANYEFRPIDDNNTVNFPNNIEVVCSQDNTRPKSSEELRLIWNTVVLAGADGVLYDQADGLELNFDENGPYWPWWNHEYSLTTLPNDPFHGFVDPSKLLISDPESLEKCEAGGDYIISQDPWKYTEYNNLSNYMRKLGIGIDSVYIGRRSVRMELFKRHKWLDENEDLLFNLELKGWYTSGYKEFYKCNITPISNRESEEKEYFSKFIDVDECQTKRIYRPYKYSGGTGENLIENSWENRDSSFFSLYIHKLKDVDMNEEFYLGVLNRRTDPIIWNDTSTIDPSAQSRWRTYFYSSAEFNDMCGLSMDTDNHPTSQTDIDYWRGFWWKRFGCREIKIQFNYQNPDNPDEYALLRITQPGYNVLSQNYTWYEEPWRDNIDTVIGQDKSITLRYLPGEGKLLKVEVLHPEEITGDLDHSNQTKLVAYF